MSGIPAAAGEQSQSCMPTTARSTTRMERAIGQAAVSDRVGRILGESPPGFAFSLVGPAEVIHDLGRLRWQTGPAGAPPVASGTDVAVFANGKIRTLYTFIETPVAAGA